MSRPYCLGLAIVATLAASAEPVAGQADSVAGQVDSLAGQVDSAAGHANPSHDGERAPSSIHDHPTIDDHPTMVTRLYMGMWTSHVRGPTRRFEGNGLLGVAVRGFYGATFINSFGDRGYAGGIQRGLGGGSGLAPSLGYRLGLVSGYDDRFMAVASSVPVLPFGQLVGNFDLGGAGAELAYAGLATSLLVSWRF